MATTTGDEATAGGGVSQGMRMPLVVTILAIAVLGGLYYLYYRNQVEYYTGRNTRLLAMLSAQIEGRIELERGFLDSGAWAEIMAQPGTRASTGIKASMESCAEMPGHVLLRGEHSAKCGSVTFDELLQPVFGRRLGGAFDMLLVADTSTARGTVLYSLKPPPPASSLLTNEEEEPAGGDNPSQAVKPAGAQTLVITSLDVLQKSKRWSGTEPLSPLQLAKATAQTPVVLGNSDYLLFSQPFAVRGGSSQWLVCGLVSASRFRYDVSTISVSIVLLAVAAILVAFCCWPFLRIALIHSSQELTVTDVALIVLCTIVGASVITLALLDIFAYRTVAGEADEQLHDFSTKLVADFGSDIVRAMTALDGAEALTRSLPATNVTTVQRFPESFRTDPRIGAYPYVTALSWIDGSGQQRMRFGPKEGAQLIPVDKRDYFKLALAGKTWTVANKQYVLEWVRSMTTGDITAVLARKTDRPDLPVIALSTELIDISQAVRPPGVDIAIIDENGAVIYHSDQERIGYENFFAESDQNRDLRSAVLGRGAAHVTATYWGDAKTMYVTPLTNSPWTLVTFRAKRLTRVLNIEAVLLALMLLLLVAVPYFAVYVLVLVIAPRYRASSLWPEETRRGEYLRLVLIYLGLLLLFVLNNWALSPWSCFNGAMVIPIVAILSTYLVLHRSGTPGRLAVPSILWLGTNAALLKGFIDGDIDTDRSFYPHQPAAKAILILAAIGVALLTGAFVLLTNGRPGRWRLASRISRIPIGYGGLYRLCGVLLLIIGVAMPVAGFFRISRHVESELLVKYGQLRAAAGLEHRVAHLERLNIRPDSTAGVRADTLGYRIGTIFGSEWSLWTPGEAAASCADPRPSDWTIAPSAAKWLPALYEDSVAIRPLFLEQSMDDLWHWCLEGAKIELVRKVRFDPDVSMKLSGAVRPFQKMHIRSDLPEERDETAQPARTNGTEESQPSGTAPLLGMLSGAIVLMLLFWYISDFIATRVLLIDVIAPHWLAHLPLSPTLGDHIFLVRRDRKVRDLVGGDAEGFVKVSYADLEATGGWSAALEKLDSSAAGRNLRITDFEYGINDGAINEKKLQWLERLLALPDRTVIVVSTVSPAYVMTTPSPPSGLTGYYERWRTLLDRFVTVTAEELELRHEDWTRRRDLLEPDRITSPKSWLEKETAYNPFLRRLRGELDAKGDPHHLLDEIGERAETYYAGLWSSCREEEKLLLYQLAKNGLANGRNRRTLRRLLARGLVQRAGGLELFSETFRLYVLAAAEREDLVRRAHAERGASTWDAFRGPFFIIIISILLLLFVTQKDLLTTTTALATALTTGLPMMMKVIGSFTDRRQGGTDHAA